MKKSIIIIFVVLVSLLFTGVWFIFKNKTVQPLAVIKIDSVVIEVELARTSKEKTLGLSGKTNLPENQGILFIYNKPGFYSFWMKDMNFPIDIIWLDENYKIIDITKNAAPESFPQTFQPQKPAQYILEVNAGFTDKYSIKIGDQADFSSL